MNIELIPVVMCSIDIPPRKLKKHLGRIEFESKIELQKTVIYSAKILLKILELYGVLLTPKNTIFFLPRQCVTPT